MRECSKRRFRDRIAAELWLSGMGRRPVRGKEPVRAYRCPHCYGWHLTSQATRQRVSS